eukprot:704761_1
MSSLISIVFFAVIVNILCERGEQIAKHPDIIKYFFEPFKRFNTNKLIQCLYQNKCDDQVKSFLQITDEDIEQMAKSPISFKTTQLRSLAPLKQVLTNSSII